MKSLIIIATLLLSMSSCNLLKDKNAEKLSEVSTLDMNSLKGTNWELEKFSNDSFLSVPSKGTLSISHIKDSSYSLGGTCFVNNYGGEVEISSNGDMKKRYEFTMTQMASIDENTNMMEGRFMNYFNGFKSLKVVEGKLIITTEKGDMIFVKK
jgi:heat shock protein HslJ